MTTLRLLHVEDSPDDAELVRHAITTRKAGRSFDHMDDFER